MSSHDAASTYSYASSSPLVKPSEQKADSKTTGSKTQALRNWTKQVVADMGHPPTYRYDLESGKNPSTASSSSAAGPFYNQPHTRT